MADNTASFRSILLQQQAVSQLSEALRRRRIAQTYLFSGLPSVGKMALAQAFTATLQCENPETAGVSPTFDACGNCDSCCRLAVESHPDVTILRPLGQNIRIDQVRQMQEQAMLQPIMGAWRIFILEDAHKLNESSANSLLKILEEAPSRVIFILLAEHEAQLLPTIRSRCENVRLAVPTPDDIRNTLESLGEYPTPVVVACVALAEGQFGRALSLARAGVTSCSPLSLEEAQMQFIREIHGIGVRLTDAFSQATSPDRAVQMLLRLPDYLTSDYLWARKCLVRGILLQAQQPHAFAVLLAELLISAFDAWRHDLNSTAETLVNTYKQAYRPDLLREFQELFKAQVREFVDAQIEDLLRVCLGWLQDVYRWTLTEDESLLLNLGDKEDIMTLAEGWGVHPTRSRIEQLCASLEGLRRNVNPVLLLENVLSELGDQTK